MEKLYPAKCISTHPVVVEAMIRFLQSKGATVLVGDSPAVHTQKFRGEKSGIWKVCEMTGAKNVSDVSAAPKSAPTMQLKSEGKLFGD